ncbi:hypothetical protein [Streptomyces specialis]|uniref:hypothetical protein n=1 Tax=Streptomyces specialis TaxID=498367 RepID=UPI00073E6E7D|nr:hypothetical protein [Streptomyces specialis]
MTQPVAFRGEFVTYSGVPEPQVIHLGEAFSTDVGEVRQWAHDRARAITLYLGDEPEVRDALLAWSREVSGDEVGHRLVEGEALIYSFTDPHRVWELTLRPVPTARLTDEHAASSWRRRGTCGFCGRGRCCWSVRVVGAPL